MDCPVNGWTLASSAQTPSWFGLFSKQYHIFKTKSCYLQFITKPASVAVLMTAQASKSLMPNNPCFHGLTRYGRNQQPGILSQIKMWCMTGLIPRISSSAPETSSLSRDSHMDSGQDQHQTAARIHFWTAICYLFLEGTKTHRNAPVETALCLISVSHVLYASLPLNLNMK